MSVFTTGWERTRIPMVHALARIHFRCARMQVDLDPASPGHNVAPWIPAEYHFTSDGLERDWFGFVWRNPPYGRDVLPRGWTNLPDTQMASHWCQSGLIPHGGRIWRHKPISSLPKF